MTSVRELCCKHNPASDEEHAVCDLCQSMIDYQPRTGFQVHLRPEEHERAIDLFGGPGGTSKRRWNALAANVESMEHVQWARLDEHVDPIISYPESPQAFEALVDAIERGDNLSSHQEYMLREGVGFHDDSRLRYLDSTWNLNGVPLHGLSLGVVFTLMGRLETRKGWDIPALLLAAASVNPNINGTPLVQRHPYGHREIRSHYRPLASMLTWLSNRLRVDRTLAMDSAECVPMMAWSHDIQTRMFERQPGNMEGMFRNALSNHPPGLFQAYDTPWMRAWQTLESAMHRADTRKWALAMNAKHLRIRVRTSSGGLRLVPVPTDPLLWAFLVSISMAPLNSEAGHLLLGLQYNWSVAYAVPNEPSAPMVRSMEFCHQIMNGLDTKVFVQSAKILVLGRLGHLYEIKVGYGQHGAPYSIKHLGDINPNLKSPLCIHSGRFADTIPLGIRSKRGAFNGERPRRLSGHRQSARTPGPSTTVRLPSRKHPSRLVGGTFQSRSTEQADTARSFRWFRRRFNEEEERRPGRGLHELLLRNRHYHRQTSSDRWNARFHLAFDRDGTFPIQDVVEEWRSTVRLYQPGSSGDHHRGDYLGGIHEGHFLRRRYHHLMPHRRADDRHDEGDVRDGERRWCEVFARVWEVLVQQPLGSTVRIPNEDGMPLSLEHAALRVTVRSPLERNFLARIAKILGYVKNDEIEDESVFVRRDHPRHDARLQLTNLLHDAQERQRVRGAPPRWWNYIDVAAPPREVPHFRWQLHIDHTDDRRARADAESDANRERGGLGDLFG